MITITSLLGGASFALAMLSYFSGILGIVRGPARPSIISRFFWLLLSITNLFSYLTLDPGEGIYLALATTLGSVALFLLSLRFGYIEFKRSDIFTVIGASISLLCYLIIPFKLIALTAGLITHFISGIPTYRKVWQHPASENIYFWIIFLVASTLSLLAVMLEGKNIIYPLYFFLFDGGMTALILWREKGYDALRVGQPG